MNNISGSAANWAKDNQATEVSNEVSSEIREKRNFSVKNELNEINELRQKLTDLYSENPNKDLFDAITTLNSSILSLKNI